jgi:hypothetical protein
LVARIPNQGELKILVARQIDPELDPREMLTYPFQKWIQTKEKKPTSDTSISYYSPSKLGALVQALMVCTIMGILLIPVFLLFLVPMSHPMMALTSTTFIFIFAIIMTVVAEGRIYEIFVGTAT